MSSRSSSFDVKKWLEDMEKFIDLGDKKQITELLEIFHIEKEHGYFRNAIFQEREIIENKKIVAYMIDNGYDVNTKDMFGCRPIEYAVGSRERNNIEVVKLLLQKGARCITSKPLYSALLIGDIAMFELFLQHGIDVNAPYDRFGTTLLIKSLMKYSDPFEKKINKEEQEKHFEIIKILVDAGANVSTGMLEGRIMPTLCLAAKRVDLTKFFLNAGARVDAVNDMGETALYWAIKFDNISTVELLIEAGCNVNHLNRIGNTCLHVAAKYSKVEMIRFFISRGFPIGRLNTGGKDAMKYCYDYWIQSGLYTCSTDSAIEFNDADKMILKKNPRVAKTIHESVQCIQLLLQYGTNMNTNMTAALRQVLSYRNGIVHSMLVDVLLLNGATFESLEQLVRSTIERPVLGSKIPHLLIKYSVLFSALDPNKELPFECDTLTEELRNYYAQCKDELEQVKEATIGNHEQSMPLFDLLSNDKVGHYARNERICDLFQCQCTSKRFPIYSDLLRQRFRWEELKQRCLKKSAKGLTSLLGWDESAFPNIIDNILKYLTWKHLVRLQSL